MKMQQMYNEFGKVNSHFHIFLSLGNVTSSICTYGITKVVTYKYHLFSFDLSL